MDTTSTKPPLKLAVFLDDEKWRHDEFERKHPEYRVYHAWNIAQFLHVMLHFSSFCQVDLVSLDHDLGDWDIEKQGMIHGNGHQAAEILAMLPEKFRPKSVIIHSWNNVGALRMRRAMTSAGYKDIVTAEFAGGPLGAVKAGLIKPWHDDDEEDENTGE